MEPSGSVDWDPFSVAVLAGRKMVRLEPALATGGILVPDELPLESFTMMLKESVAEAPRESVTVNLKTYTPSCKPEIVVAALSAVVMWLQWVLNADSSCSWRWLLRCSGLLKRIHPPRYW